MMFEPDARLDGEAVPAFPSRWILFRGDDLLVPEGEPFLSVGRPFPVAAGSFPLGRLDGRPCHVLDLDSAGLPDDFFPGLRRLTLRELLQAQDEEIFRVYGLARQLLEWHRAHRHCGFCGAPTAPAPGERAFACPACGRLWWPRVTPAVIVAVTDGDRILLGHNRAFAGGVFSTFAGFVEPGETLEEACAREVREESGVSIDGLRYFASQPWPFPSSLMLAFTARYAGGEPRADGVELTEVRWFGRHDPLPQFPGRGGMGRRLIEWFQTGGGIP